MAPESSENLNSNPPFSMILSKLRVEPVDWDPRIVMPALFFLFMAITTVGMIGLPSDFRVEPEYLSGMLTASVILFGFWAVLIQKEPKEDIEKWRFKHLIGKSFFMSFVLLMLSVVVIYYAALDKLPSPVALFLCMLSFLMNALLITIQLYFQRFRG